jgi:hypothetical protein
LLTFDGLLTLNWTWTNANPDHWTFETSVNGNTEWTLDHQSAAATRSYTPPANALYWRLAGRTATGQLETGYSNIVQMGV